MAKLIILAGFGLLFVGQIDAINFTVDDSFISLRYAENAASGKGLVFNAGERVEGYSNLLWTLMLTGFARAGITQQRSPFALLIAAKLVGFILGFATLAVLAVGVVRMRRHGPRDDSSDLLSLAVLCTAATYSFPLWNVSGLETPLAAFLVTTGGVLTVEGLRRYDETGVPSTRCLLAGGLAFGLAVLVRPEQVFIWALAMTASLVTMPPQLRSALLRSALPVLAFFLGLIIWRWGYYHTLIPNSVVAKAGGATEMLVIGFKYAVGGFVAIVGFVALGLLGLPALLMRGTAWRFLALYSAAYGLFILVSGGDWMPGFRFFAPVVPLLWLLCTGSLLAFTARLRPTSSTAVAALVSVLAVGSFASGRALVRSQMQFPTGLKGLTWEASPTRVALARELAVVIPPHSLLALFEAGYVPYFNPQLRILDNSGLMDPVIARLPGRHMFKASADYFLRRHPDYYLTMLKWGSPSADAVEILRSPEFQARYEQVKVFDSRQRNLESVVADGQHPIEEDLTFVLYRRRQDKS